MRTSSCSATILGSLLLLACQGESSRVAGDAAAPEPSAAPTAPMAPGSRREAASVEFAAGKATEAADALGAGTSAQLPANQAVEPMLIRTGTARVEVDSLEVAVDAVRALASGLGGYVAGTSLQVGRDQARTGTLDLRVPAARFDDVLGGLRPLGRVEAVNVNAEEVGEEYADLGARVANARRLEERLVTLLERRTGKLDDVLAVERELARVREGIERLEGRMRYLRTRAAMSTLTVTVHETMPLAGPSVAPNPLGEAVRQAWRNFLAVVAALIASLGIVLPLGGLGAVAWLVWRRLAASRPVIPPGGPDAREEGRAA
jgi:hypothetical protein